MEKKSREELVQGINEALESSTVGVVRQLEVIAARLRPSGDVTLYAEGKRTAGSLLQYQNEWLFKLGPQARTTARLSE